MIANVSKVLNGVRSDNFPKKTFQNTSWLVDGHEVWL